MHEGTVLRPAMSVVLYGIQMRVGLPMAVLLSLYGSAGLAGLGGSSLMTWLMIGFASLALGAWIVRLWIVRRFMERTITLGRESLDVDGRWGRATIPFAFVETAREVGLSPWQPTSWRFRMRGEPTAIVYTEGLDRREREDLRAFLVERLGDRVAA